MGWNNPDIPWSELERLLSGRPRNGASLSGGPQHGDGGDSPAWSRKREPYVPPDGPRPLPTATPGTPYAELHCHSNYSFLDGASHPEELVEEAARLGLDAVALTDHDGMYGVVRFAEAARELGVRTVYGAELSLGLPAPQNGIADPLGSHLLLLARGPEGYRRLCRVISVAQLRGGEKGRPVYDLDEVVAETVGHVVALTGCRKGSVRQAMTNGGPAAAASELRRLVEMFGAENVAVELTDHGLPTDTERNDLLAALAAGAGLPTVATTAAHYAAPQRYRLATALAAVRARRSLDEIDGWLPPAGTAHLRSGAEMAETFDGRYPGAVERAASLGRELAFELRLIAPDLPPFAVPPEHTEASYLRELTYRGMAERYGSYDEYPEAVATVEKELAIIESKNFPGYFLIVHDIVRFCKRADILCQGRGSAANSAVCYALGITNVDAVAHRLLFERFLSPARDGYPDIDLDIESDRREEAIQYVYEKYERTHSAQVANVITYRPRSAVRDMAKAMGFSPGQQDAWSKRIERWGASVLAEDGIPEHVIELADELLGFPRHLGIHSGGMVICDRPVSEVVPVEWARMQNRSVVQWDKDDCATAGLVKFDLLGLGMLTALHLMIDLVAEHHGRKFELHELQPVDEAVYAMLRKADSVGVFQVESRAQMATLPRLQAAEVLRPGRRGRADPPRSDPGRLGAPLHPAPQRGRAGGLRPSAARGRAEQDAGRAAVPGAAHADRGGRCRVLRRGRRRAAPCDGRQAVHREDGAAARPVLRRDDRERDHRRGRGPDLREDAGVRQLRLPGEPLDQLRLAGLLQRLVQAVLPGGVLRGAAQLAADGLLLAAVAGRRRPPARRRGVRPGRQRGRGGGGVGAGLALRRWAGRAVGAVERAHHRRRAGRARSRTNAARAAPYADLADLSRRVRLTVPQAEALATAGAFGCFRVDRRSALWAAGVVAAARPEQLPGTAVGLDAPMLPGMTDVEETVADVWATGVSPGSHPMEHLRERLDGLGASRVADLAGVGSAERVLVGGLITHRQRPATAAGVTFLNLEDETGMLNVVCSQGLWARFRKVAIGSAALLVRGRLERAPDADGLVLSLAADRLQRLSLQVAVKSRDFR